MNILLQKSATIQPRACHRERAIASSSNPGTAIACYAGGGRGLQRSDRAASPILRPLPAGSTTPKVQDTWFIDEKRICLYFKIFIFGRQNICPRVACRNQPSNATSTHARTRPYSRSAMKRNAEKKRKEKGEDAL